MNEVTGSADTMLKELTERIETSRKKCGDGRTRVARANAYESFQETVAEANTFCEFFGLPSFTVPEPIEAVETVLKEERARKAEKEKAERAERDRRAAEYAREQHANLMLWIAGDTSARHPHGLPCSYMRVRGDIVETTQGATVPVGDVRKVAPLILRAVQSGKRFRPDTDIMFGHFRLNYIDESGTVHVGCHAFERSEIERFASVLASLPSAETVSAE
jgi:hypothetical protein